MSICYCCCVVFFSKRKRATELPISDGISNVCSSDLSNQPPEVHAVGKSDPNVRKATAIINGEIITGTDVDQRLALIITANGGKVEEQEKERLRLQVLRNLIDEKIGRAHV